MNLPVCMWLLAVMTFGAGTSRDIPLKDKLIATLQPLLDERANRLNSGFQLAFKNEHVALELVSGATRRTDDPSRYPAPPMTTSDRLLFGSVTKMYTTASIMHLVERGLVGLDDPASIHVDAVLAASNLTSLEALFGPSAARVTVRYLLSMRSGIYDYDDDETRAYQNAHPDTALSPLDDLSFASTRGHKTPLYEPGTHQDYSSTNFELLGLILQRYAGASTWDQLDQRLAAFPTDTLQSRFPNTTFALHGKCSEHTRVHGYEPDDQYGMGLDTAFLSCTNGFTCGNIVAPAREVADWVWSLYRPGDESIVSTAAAAQMRQIYIWYGLGTMDLPSYGQTDKRYCRYGHFGVTYGFTANAAYNPGFDFSIAWGTNQEDPGQTATHGAQYDFLMQFDCELLSAVVGVLSAGTEPPLNCAWAAVNASQGGVCKATAGTKEEPHAASESQDESGSRRRNG